MMHWIKEHSKGFYIYGGMIGVFVLMVILAVVPQSTLPYNNVALDLGFAQIAWYAVFILTGISLASFLSYLEFKKKGLDTEILFDALLWGIPLAILGTRIYYVIFDPTPNYKTIWDVLDFTSGGLAIHGGVIVATIFLIIYTKVKKVNFWFFLDIIAVGFFVGQIIGRWGNFMNQEAYGPAIQSQWILNILPNFIKNQMAIGNAIHHPTFLYEGMWNFVGLVFLLIARRKRWFKVGDMMGLYLIWYGLGRGAIIEPLRTQGAVGDALRIFGLPVNILLSLTLFMLGGIALILAKRKMIPDQLYYVDLDMSQIENIENPKERKKKND